MGFFSRDIQTMEDLFIQTLRDIYYAEQKIVQALPEMIENSANPRLKSGLEQHLAQTRQQIHRLEQVFEMHGSQPKAVDCPAIDGIIKEAKEIMGDVNLEDKRVLDAPMIAARRRWSTMRSPDTDRSLLGLDSSALMIAQVLQRGPTQTMHMRFINPDGSEIDANIAYGPRDFICRRLLDESLEAFKARADAEVLACKFRVPFAGLIFRQEGIF